MDLVGSPMFFSDRTNNDTRNDPTPLRIPLPSTRQPLFSSRLRSPIAALSVEVNLTRDGTHCRTGGARDAGCAVLRDRAFKDPKA